MSDAIAIDFGTSRTKVAYWDERSGKPQLVRLGYGDEPFVPSLFYLPRASEEILWGCDAEEMLQEDSAGIVEVLKRHLQDRYVFANHRKVSPQDLLTLMFRRLREQVGQEVLALQGALPAKAMLTLPALYGPAVEKRLREAARAAAFSDVERISSINALFPRSLEYPGVVRRLSTRIRRDVGRDPRLPSRRLGRRRKRLSDGF